MPLVEFLHQVIVSFLENPMCCAWKQVPIINRNSFDSLWHELFIIVIIFGQTIQFPWSHLTRVQLLNTPLFHYYSIRARHEKQKYI